MNDSCSHDGVTRRTLFRTAAAVGGSLALGGCTPAVTLAAPTGEPVPPEAVEVVGDTTGFATRLVLLGTAGGPTYIPGRTGIASAVTVGGRPYLVDAGASTTRRLGQAGIQPKALGGVFVTHMHSDHIAELFTLFWLNIVSYLAGPPAQPTPVFGPAADELAEHEDVAGVHGMLDAFREASAHEVDVRNAETARVDYRDVLVGRDIKLPKGVRALQDDPAPDMDPFVVFEDERVQVSAILVPHGAAFPSFAFRFDTESGSVTFSGDTAKSANVAKLAAGTDILVHEVVDVDYYARKGFGQDVLDHMRNTHTTAQDVGRVATEADARKVVLSHIGPGDPREITDDEWVARVRTTYTGPVVVGRDLTAHGVGARI